MLAATCGPQATLLAVLNDADRKRLATLTARAALAGIVLHASTNDAGRLELIATRWALTRCLASLDEAEQWLNTVTGTRG